MTRAWIGVALSFVALGCAPSGPMTEFGFRCTDDAECVQGTCSGTPSSSDRFCTTTCSAASPCPRSSSGQAFVCGEAGECVRPCTLGATQGSGASLELCQASGTFAACSGLDEATSCQACGCEPFGGGRCTPGVGCEIPLADGMACTRDTQCTSGTCYRDTDVCGPKRALRAACSADVECESANCSTNGDETLVGRCNVRFGQSCTREDPCDDCEGADPALFTTGRCLRTTCNPTNARCGTIDRAQFECVESTDGMFRCYQRCSEESGCYFRRRCDPTDIYCS